MTALSMLRELHISNLAVIADARIEFDAGLNCFTGATGAGKSLVIGAIELLLGLRTASELLRPGVEEGRVSGVFELDNPQLLARIEQLTDAPVTKDGGELLLVRRLHASGRSSVTLNGNPITLGMLKQVGEALVDVHGQHDHQYLLKPSNQLDVLDQFGDLDELRNNYHDVYLKGVETKSRIEALSADRTLRRQQLELYRFQAEEIDAAQLDPAEFAELAARSSVLSNLEKLKKDVGATHSALYEADGSVLERLRMMGAVLWELALLDVNLKGVADSLRDSSIQLEEVAFDLSRYLDKLDLDPSELAEVNERLNLINRLLNKYGDPLETTLAYRLEIGQTISQLERATDEFSSLQAELTPLLAELKKLGMELTSRRQGIAKKLAPLVESQLSELGMENAKFRIAFSAAVGSIAGEDLSASAGGFDQVEFIAQTNPGQLPQPLRKIASGGELSRIMLALKGILAQSDRISVLVFDEIDANVGGRLGSTIGHKLRQLASHHQVLCITHLPQIASYAGRHLTVGKEVIDDETSTSVRIVTGPDRIEELAEMIGGHRVTPTTRAQAQELLDAAANPAMTSDPKTAGKNGKPAKKLARR
jgi:DNA repair protein RecN (Recombination protein N)